MQTGLETGDPNQAICSMIAGGPVSWKSRKQESVALSTAEAEYIALSSAAQETVWIRRLVTELGNEPEGPITLMEDNQSSIYSHGQFNSRAKHIAILTSIITSLERRRHSTSLLSK